MAKKPESKSTGPKGPVPMKKAMAMGKPVSGQSAQTSYKKGGRVSKC